jgi:hypothetical protein
MNNKTPGLVKIGESCAGCKYFSPDDDPNKDLGECRRYPPQVTLFIVGMQQQTGEPIFNRATSRALTRPGDYCGEYRVALLKVN